MQILQKLNGWKKIIGLVVGVIAPIAGAQIGLDREVSLQVSAAILAYLFAQGVADHGKNKPKIDLYPVGPPVPIAKWGVDPSSPDKTPFDAPVRRRTRKVAPVEHGPMPVAPV